MNAKELNLGKGILKFYFSLRQKDFWESAKPLKLYSTIQNVLCYLVGRKAWVFKKHRKEKKMLYIFKKLKVYQY